MTRRRTRSPLLLLLLVPALVAGTSCVTSSDIDGLHRQMNDIERQIQVVENKSSSKEEVQKLNTTLSSQTDQLLRSNADASVKLQELSRQIETLQAKLDDTNRRLAELSQQIAATQATLGTSGTAANSPAVGNPIPNPVTPATVAVSRPAPATPAPVPAPPSPQQLYDTAYGDYTKGRYDLAIAGFQQYIQQYPNTDLTDNAQYWTGECEFAQKKYEQAINDFDTLLRRWPQSDKAPGALLKKGYALDALNRRAEAVVALQYVIHEYPASDEARLAQQKLNSWGIAPR